MLGWLCGTAELTLAATVMVAVWAQPRVADRVLRTASPDEQLVTASAAGDRDAFEDALRQGARPGARDRIGATALTSAAMAGEVQTVERLLALGVDVNAPDARGITPLMYAAGANHLPVVRLLLAHGADITASYDGQTALDWAISSNSQPCVRLLSGRAKSPPRPDNS